jgi:hypothetical protein
VEEAAGFLVEHDDFVCRGYCGSSGAEEVDWLEWAAFIAAHREPSFFLMSGNARALLENPERAVAALVWRRVAPFRSGGGGDGGMPYNGAAVKGEIVGVSLMEDARAESHDLMQHLDARNGLFRLAAKWLHRHGGVLGFDVRVVGPVLGSGSHAYRFLEDGEDGDGGLSEELARAMVEQVAEEAPALRQQARRPPGVRLVKDFEVKRGEEWKWRKGWLTAEFDPCMVLPIPEEWKTMEDYTRALRTKARTKTNRILKLSEGCVIREMELKEIRDRREEIHGLYLSVFGGASFRLGALTPDDFVLAKRHGGDDFRLWAYEVEGEMLGFQCGYRDRGQVEAFFVGFNPEENRKRALYQRMLLHFIAWAIDINTEHRELILGRTALDIKSSVGGLPVRLVCAVRFRNPYMQGLAALAVRWSKPAELKLKSPWKQDQVAGRGAQ